MGHMAPKKVFELNPHHRIVKELKNKVDVDKNDKSVDDLVRLLYETSLLTSGFSLTSPDKFVNRIHKLISLGLSLEETVEVVETVETVNTVPVEQSGSYESPLEQVD